MAQAMGDRILVRKAEMCSKTKGGIYLADSVKKDGMLKLNVGRVLSFGPGLKTVQGEYIPGYSGKVGDVVMWEQFGEFGAEGLGENVNVIRNEDVICLLDEKEAIGWKFEKDEVVETENVPTYEEKTREYHCANRFCQTSKLPSGSPKISQKESDKHICEYCGAELELVIYATPGYVH